MARRFHNDAVIDVRRVRRKTVVRVFRLAGHAELPSTIEFDDELPRRPARRPADAPPRRHLPDRGEKWRGPPDRPRFGDVS